MNLRAATIADVPRIVALVESAYRGPASRAGWTTEADLLDGQRTDAEDVRGCIERDRSRVILAFDGGGGGGGGGDADVREDLIACAHVADEEGTGYFGMFAVVPTRQGGGVGKHVLAEAERIVRDEWQLSTMHMTVIAVRTELIAFYERRGYARTGRFKPFPYGEERFGIPRRDDLQFEVLAKPMR